MTDYSVGILPEDVGEIFDTFFTTMLGSGGTGMGMYISHNMVCGPLGGRMLVQSTPEVGSVFTLMLPFWGPGSRRIEVLDSKRFLSR